MNKRHLKELEKVKRSVYNCKKCGVCGNRVTGKVPYVCPVRESTPGFEHFYARGKTIIAQGLLEGAIDLCPELAEAVYSCTLCGNCMTQCKTTDNETGLPLVETIRIVEALRADFFREHPEWVDRPYTTALKSTRQYDNPWGVPRATREKWAKGLALKDVRKAQADVLLFAGCTIPTNSVLAARAKKAVALLQKADVDLGILGKGELCCGSVQRKIGDFALADELMRKNIELLNSTGCSTIITLCAGCCNTLKNDYPGAGAALNPKVYHLVEYLSKLIREKKLTLTKPQNLKVSYHDPCHLGRHAGIFNPPRDILQALPGIELVERRATRENTICCGAGGGMRLFANGALAEKMGRAALLEARKAGAEALVTACPFCEMNLDAAAQGLDSPMSVYDMVDLVHEAIH